MRTPDTEQTIMIVLSSDPDSGSGVVACGPLFFVFDEAIFQHQIRNFGLFQAKTSDYGL